MRSPERHVSAILEAADGLEDLLLADIATWPGSSVDADALAAWRERLADAHGRAAVITASLCALGHELAALDVEAAG